MSRDNDPVERRLLTGASVGRGEEMLRNERRIREWDPASPAAVCRAGGAGRPFAGYRTLENFPLTGVERCFRGNLILLTGVIAPEAGKTLP